MFKESNKFEKFESKVWLSSPTMHGPEIEYVKEAYETNWMSTVGKNINEVERMACEYIGCKYAVALSAGTASLHLAMKLAGIEAYGMPKVGHGALEGKKVFCSDMTFDATVNPVVYEGGEPAFRRGFFLAQGLTDESGSMIYTLTSLENSHWRVVGVSFVEELITESVQEVSRILAASGIGILLAAVIISFVLFRTLSRPMHGLTAAMRQFEQDADNFTYVPVGGAREVRVLSDSFGQMVVQIQRLMEQVRAEEVNLRKTELRALQAQINPHFLYNTLDSIAWMCEQGRNAEAVEMVNALARLFRISISRGHELIPIRSELQHAESYLQIQSHRYKNQFSYSFDVQEECLDYLCNKITLQPIIENAIYHGINGLVDEGEIRISCRADGDDILFTVEDNGTGMEPEQVQAILRKERSDHTGIGIKNVNDRLKIYFGPAYGITIDSVPDEGTRVYIRMPKVREEAEYEKR